MNRIGKQVFSWLIIISIGISLLPMAVIAEVQNQDPRYF